MNPKRREKIKAREEERLRRKGKNNLKKRDTTKVKFQIEIEKQES